MKLKIISAGSGDYIHVVDAATGEELENVVGVKIRADADMFGGEPRVTLQLTDVAVEVLSRCVRTRPAGKYGPGVWP